MNCEEFKPMFPEYWDGTLDEAGRLILEVHFDRCAGCRTEAADLRDVWMRLSALPPDPPAESMRLRFYDRLDAYRQAMADKPRPWWSGWRIPMPALAFGLALLAVGFFAGSAIDFRRDNPQLTQLRTEVSNMRQLVALSLLQQENAADRLQGVSYAYRVDRSDTEVLAALLSALNHDENVNVRLAAVEAMRRFGASPVARRGLAQAIARQESPLVQIALLDQLVALKERDARPTIQQLISTTSTSTEVREHAQWALQQIQ